MIAGTLGIRYLRIFAGFAPPEAVTGRRADVQRACLERAAAACIAHGAAPAVETHGGVAPLANGAVRHVPSTTTTPRTLDKMLEAVPGLRLLFDPANVRAVGEDPCAFYRRYRERIALVHLKDFAPAAGGGLLPVACGEGALDWPELLPLVAEAQGPLLIEYENPGDAADSFRRSLAFLEGLGVLGIPA